jgi:hypothetical protein
MQDISEQETMPLRLPSSTFQAYLEHYQLTWLAVAQAARVPGAVVWLIAHGRPVLPENARKVKEALHLLTGVMYSEPIKVVSS